MNLFRRFKPVLSLGDGNLQFFGAEFDVDAADAAIAAEEDVDTDVDTDEDFEDTEIDESLVSDVDTDEDDSLDSGTPDISTDDGRDAAFAQIRRERDQAAADAAFIRKFAEDNGMTVEQLREQHEEARLAKEAETQGVPVDVIKRLSHLESENEQVKAQAQTERFNAQVDATLAKYNATQADFDATIQYARENGLAEGLRTGAITFEAAYKLANMDTMIESAKKNAVQEDLSARKKRQQEAPLAAGSQSHNASTTEFEDQADADAKEILANGDF